MPIETIEASLVPIPKGTINLRDDRKGRQWSVELSSFLVSRYQVTQGIYSEFSGGPSPLVDMEDRPVDSVSWFDVASFCNRLSVVSGFAPFYSIGQGNQQVSSDETSTGYRLLTDAEWQYACQAGTPGPRYGELTEIAWFRDNAGGRHRAVGLKKPNAWGLYDMLGNVWEWCSDVYDPDVYGAYRVFRGGGWADEARGCLATNRRRSHPTFSIDDLGFRIARTL